MNNVVPLLLEATMLLVVQGLSDALLLSPAAFVSYPQSSAVMNPTL